MFSSNELINVIFPPREDETVGDSSASPPSERSREFCVVQLRLIQSDHARRSLHNSTRKKGLCRNRVNSLLSVCKPLFEDFFKPRPRLDRNPKRHIDFRTEGSIVNFASSKKRCVRCLNRFDRSDYSRNLGCGDLKDLARFLQSLSCSPSDDF